MHTFLIIDGNSILNRAYYGIKPLTAKDGTPTNAVYGFFNILGKLKNEFAPSHYAVAFDLKAPTFRHTMYDGYKASRKGMPDDLAVQLPIVKELLAHLGYRTVECEGFEADDILGTLSLLREQDGEPIKCVIATGDRDSLQLISDSAVVSLQTTKGGVLYDTDKIFETYALKPHQLIDLKAIMGDSSDNIPGAAGIGEKGGLELIRNFHSVDYIYDNLDTLPIKDGTKKKLSDSKETVMLSRQLAKISTNVPVTTELGHYEQAPVDAEGAAALLRRLDMTKLLATLSPNSAGGKPKSNAAISDDLIMVTGDGGEALTNDAKALYKSGYEGVISFASDLAGYVLNPSLSSYTMSSLCGIYDIDDDTPEECLKTLHTVMVNKLAETESLPLLQDIELPLSRVLSDMENTGFTLDVGGIKQFGEDLSRDIKREIEAIYGYAGEEFNVNSTKQLGDILFNKLTLPTRRKTKSGYSTDADVLKSLLYAHPIIAHILEYRALAKLSSTYVEGLLKAVSPDGRIRTTFIQTETRTGRISSVEPNLQNIPIRTQRGAKLREFFIAGEGYSLVTADYSQIELRVLADISGDENMRQAFLSNEDIHRQTASQVFHVPPESVTPLMRGRAKAVNFGIVYGIGGYSLSQDIGVSLKEANEYIRHYLEHYSGINDYLKRSVAEAAKNGYASTKFGRRRYIPELGSANKQVRAFGERIAMNMPIQGTAADLIKLAMIKVHDRLKREAPDAKLILQVHDELVIECKNDIAKSVSSLLKEEMESAAALSIPLAADVKISGHL